MSTETTTADRYLTLSDATRHLPGRPHTSSVWRWCRKGVKARNGERIKLQSWRYGGRVYTTLEALDAFGRAMAEADAEHFDDPNHGRVIIDEGRSESKRDRAVRRAVDELAADGI